LDVSQAAKAIKRKILAVTVDLKLQLNAENLSLKRDLIRARFAQQLADKRADAAAKDVVLLLERSPPPKGPATGKNGGIRHLPLRATCTILTLRLTLFCGLRLPDSRAKMTLSRKSKHQVNS
jgi:hypothetical protein